MKGLIIKDFYCLRKSMKTFVILTIGIIIVSILTIMSMQYGNLADNMKSLETEQSLDLDFVEKMFECSILCMLLIPIAFVGNLADCFKEDLRVHFKKILLSMPLTPLEIVGSRYLTCLLLSAFSIGLSLFAGLIISSVPGSYDFEQLLASVLSFGGGFLIYMSLNLFLIYAFGSRKADLLQLLPLIILYLAVGSHIFTTTSTMSAEQLDQYILNLINKLSSFLENGYALLLLMAAACMLLSYIGSVMIFKYRKGEL